MDRLSKTLLSELAKLSQKKWRVKHSLFIAEGEKCVADISKSFDIKYVIVNESNKELIGRISTTYPSEKVKEASYTDIKKLSTLSTPADVIGIFHIPASDVEAPTPELDPTQLYLILDSVQDPGNLGTIIRTAHWFGISDIFASLGTADVYNSKTVQSTMGSLGKVKIHYVDIQDLIKINKNIPTYGTFMKGESIYSAHLSKGGMIVMGNEGKGISPQIERLITNRLTIPPASENHSESLNVAIATAITLAFFRK